MRGPTLPPARGRPYRRPVPFYKRPIFLLCVPVVFYLFFPYIFSTRHAEPSNVPLIEVPLHAHEPPSPPPAAEMAQQKQHYEAVATVDAAAATAALTANAPPAAASSCTSFELHTDTDMLHGDLSEAPHETGVSLDTCCEHCLLHHSCVGLTLTPAGDCWLKSSVGQTSKQRGLTSAIHVKRAAAGNTAHSGAAEAADGARVRQMAHEAVQRYNKRHDIVEQRTQREEQEKLPPQARRRASAVPVGPVVNVAEGCSSDPSVGCMANPAVIVMSHNREEMTRRCLGLLVNLPLVDKFTIYVSEDANSQKVRDAAKEFGSRVHEVLSFTPKVGMTPFTRGGVSKIAQHFEAAAEAVFTKRKHSHAIFIEDDLLLSPDFLTLFWESAWLLRADPTLWCVSAWNDQGFPHTAQDAGRLLRTDYFPGLGWMVASPTWEELRGKWPAAPTTGWDHWMRLGTTSHGRECVAPEINRSRHASKRGTNVMDNKPFERFAFEKVGVQTFGDLSYLLRDKHEATAQGLVKSAKRLSWPGAWGGSTQFESAVGWMGQLPSEPPQLLLYSREEYKGIAKALGLWGENQRATSNGTITLKPNGGGTLLLADRRKCPYLEESERIKPPPGLQQLRAPLGVSCDEACAKAGARCDASALEWGNNCDAMAKFFRCEAGCGHQVGPELPAYASAQDLDTHGQCLISDIAVSTCKAAFKKTERLCGCV